MEYNFTKGLGKGLKFVLTALAGLALVTGFSDLTIWSLLEEYLKPIISSLTVGGILTILLNYTKIKFGGIRGLLGLKK